MKTIKITELPKYNTSIHEMIELAAYNKDKTYYRVNIGENTFHTEEEAIERIKEIYRGMEMVALILPYRE